MDNIYNNRYKIGLAVAFLFFLASAGVYAQKSKEVKKQLDLQGNSVESKVETASIEGNQPVVEEEKPEENTQATAITQTKNEPTGKSTKYPLHKNISTTLFWVGEGSGPENMYISNVPSAWADDWVKEFGGVDSPKKRNGYLPAKFTPKENPFYFALPYNDFNEFGQRRNDAAKIIPWAKSRKWKDNESMVKNQWIKITKNGKSAYAQWEDVGPLHSNDAAYVFGSADPKAKFNQNVGLDVSLAVNDYLNLSDIDKTDWQFVDARDVPDGPWKKIISTSQTNWE